MHKKQAVQLAEQARDFAHPPAPGASLDRPAPIPDWVAAAVAEAYRQGAQDRGPSFVDAVVEMNEAFGNPQGDPVCFYPMLDLSTEKEEHFDGNAWALVLREAHNIRGELGELAEAYEARNIHGVRDAFCDIVVFVIGAYHKMGFNIHRDMREVVRAVMTRFCQTPEQLEATKRKYDLLGVTYDVHGTFPRVYLKSNRNQQMPEYPKGKFLKVDGYEQPQLYRPESCRG